MADQSSSFRWLPGTLLVLAAASFLIYLWEGPADDAQQPAEAEPLMPAAEAPTLPFASADPPETGTREETIDRGIARGDFNADYRDALIAADTDEEWQELLAQAYVIPTTRREGDGTSCHPIMTADDLRLCWNHYGFHPYLGQTVEDLRLLGDSDPAAANALALLLSREEQELRMYYALQAAHLSQKPGPLYQYALRLSATGVDHQRRLEQYALLRLGDELGSPINLSRPVGRDLRRDMEMTDEEFEEASREAIQSLFDRAKRARWQP